MEGFYVFFGTVLGFLLGLVGSEVRTSWQRSRRRTGVAKLMKAEVVVNSEKLEETLNDHKQAVDENKWALTSPFHYEAYNSCMPDLALLGDEAMMAVFGFYARLHHIERVPRDALRALTQLYGVFRAGREKDNKEAISQEQALLQAIHTWVVDKEEQAKEAANKAKVELDKVIAQHKRWCQRTVAR